jgi:hypothetical protein
LGLRIDKRHKAQGVGRLVKRNEDQRADVRGRRTED